MFRLLIVWTLWLKLVKLVDRTEGVTPTAWLKSTGAASFVVVAGAEFV